MARGLSVLHRAVGRLPAGRLIRSVRHIGGAAAHARTKNEETGCERCPCAHNDGQWSTASATRWLPLVARPAEVQRVQRVLISREARQTVQLLRADCDAQSERTGRHGWVSGVQCAWLRMRRERERERESADVSESQQEEEEDEAEGAIARSVRNNVALDHVPSASVR